MCVLCVIVFWCWFRLFCFDLILPFFFCHISNLSVHFVCVWRWSGFRIACILYGIDFFWFFIVRSCSVCDVCFWCCCRLFCFDLIPPFFFCHTFRLACILFVFGDGRVSSLRVICMALIFSDSHLFAVCVMFAFGVVVDYFALTWYPLFFLSYFRLACILFVFGDGRVSYCVSICMALIFSDSHLFAVCVMCVLCVIVFWCWFRLFCFDLILPFFFCHISNLSVHFVCVWRWSGFRIACILYGIDFFWFFIVRSCSVCDVCFWCCCRLFCFDLIPPFFFCHTFRLACILFVFGYGRVSRCVRLDGIDFFWLICFQCVWRFFWCCCWLFCFDCDYFLLVLLDPSFLTNILAKYRGVEVLSRIEGMWCASCFLQVFPTIKVSH